MALDGRERKIKKERKSNLFKIGMHSSSNIMKSYIQIVWSNQWPLIRVDESIKFQNFQDSVKRYTVGTYSTGNSLVSLLPQVPSLYL